MKRKHTILSILKWTGLTLVLLIVAVLLLLAVNTDFSSPADTETFIHNKINKAGIPGISIAMVRGDEVVKTIQIGYADIGNQIPVTEETIFQIASTSKTVTGTAIMQLYERGLLELDADINQYLPFEIRHPLYPDAPITTRQLLTHSAGMKDHWAVYDSFYTIGTGGGDSEVSLEEFVRGYFTVGGEWYDARENFTESAPGVEWRYSNTGYAVLGYLVEVVSGVSFPEYCEANIFTPLDMPNTAWLYIDTDTDKMAVPYDGKEALPKYSFATYPDGGLKTTPTEFAHLYIAMLHEGQYQGRSILRPETVREMLTPSAREGKQALAYNYSVLEEMFLPNLDNGHVIGHTGGDPGICTLAVFNPQNQTGLVMFMNQTPNVNFKIINLNRLVERLVTEAGIVP